jgi:hypothetical protein
MKTFLVQIEEITFDLDCDDEMDYDEEIKLQNMLQETYINKTYEISAETEEEAHDELMEMVTDDTGWCIHSMTSVTL